MNVNLNLGYNFDTDLPDMLNKLNGKYYHENGNRVASVYGSIAKHAWLSARPDFRLPDMTEQELSTHVKRLSDVGIEFNYALNNIYPGSKEEFLNRKDEFCDIVGNLEKMGVTRLIISNPMVIEALERWLPGLDIKIELSTIMHVDTAMQLIALKKLSPRIDRVVGNILHNRDFNKLPVFARVAESLGMTYEVMVNEFCLNSSGGDNPLAAHCVYRDSCYLCHAENVTKQDALAMSNYPMSKCMSSRAHNSADWLRAFTALPQHLRHYIDIGINHFKVTGRTAKLPYIEFIADAYLSEYYEGNLLTLWKPLETIYSDKDELSEHKQRQFVDCSKLDGFFHPWVNQTIDCSVTLCSECGYCDRAAEQANSGFEVKFKPL